MARMSCLPMFGWKHKGKVVVAVPTKAMPPWETCSPVISPASEHASVDPSMAQQNSSQVSPVVFELPTQGNIVLASVQASVDELEVHGLHVLAGKADYEGEALYDTAASVDDHIKEVHLCTGSAHVARGSEQDYGGSLQGYPSCLTEGSPSEAGHLTASDPGTMSGARQQLQNFGRSCSGVFSEMKPSEENESCGHRLSDYSLNSGLVDGSYAPTEAMPQAYEKVSIAVRTRSTSRSLAPHGFSTTRSEGSARSVDDGVMFGMGPGDRAMSAPPKKPWWKVTLRAHRSVPLNASKQASKPVCISQAHAKATATSHQLGFYGSDGDDCGGLVSPPSANDAGLCRSGGSAATSADVSPVQSAHVQVVIEQVPAGTVDGVGMDAGTINGAWPDSPSHLDGLQVNTSFVFPGKHRVDEWFATVDLSVPFEEEVPFTDVVAPVKQSECAEDSVGRQVKEGTARHSGQSDGPVDVDMALAVAAARALHPLATVAHYSGTGLRIVPPFGQFTLLKTINLSANSLVRIPPGCFPKSVHCLDLSRNKIVAIEGLRELTRLRTLNLSSNRITRIGHGLAHCTSLRELYLGANKISEVEGLHRLLKLTILDVSFNKVAEVAGLNQLAANYLSLQELNVSGNGLCKNMGEEQLKKFIGGLCPSVVYLNKQPLKAVTRGEGVAKVGSSTSYYAQRGMKSSNKVVKKGGSVQMIPPGQKRSGSGEPSKISNHGVTMPSQAGQNGKNHGILTSSRHRQGHGHHHNREKRGRRSVESSPVVHLDVFGPRDLIPRIQSDGALNHQDESAEAA